MLQRGCPKATGGGASAKVRAAPDALAGHLRDRFNFVRGIGSYAISAPDRLGVFMAYGWEQGEIGNLSDARIEALANQAITATPWISDPARPGEPSCDALGAGREITEEHRLDGNRRHLAV